MDIQNYLLGEYEKFLGDAYKGTLTKSEIAYRWQKLFCKQLKLWDFNGQAQDQLYAWGRRGHNWKKLHPTDEEMGFNDQARLELFLNEVRYCYDRMCLDRLFRCHWLFNQYMQGEYQVSC